MPLLCFIAGTSIKAAILWPLSNLGSPSSCSELGVEINASEMDRICISLKGSCRSRRRNRREGSVSNTAAADRCITIGECGRG
jgi:hypothetical protein